MPSRILHGARISLAVGITAVLVSAGIGVPLGLWAGYAGGRVDNVLMRIGGHPDGVSGGAVYWTDYSATYGSLGAMIGMMMWIYLSLWVVLVGAELNAEIEHQTALNSQSGRTDLWEGGKPSWQTRWVGRDRRISASASHSTRSVTLRRASRSLSRTKLRTSLSLSVIARNSDMLLFSGLSRLPGRVQALEEELDSDAENLRDLQQTARTDAIRAFFIFLNLLEGEAEGIS